MESLGQSLKSARESKGLTIRQAAEDTRIGSRYLEALEAGRYGDLPGGMYNRAFLRTYAEYLGLDSHAVVSAYDSATSPPTEKTIRSRPRPPQHRREFRPSPLVAWSTMLVLSVAGLFFSRHWISGVFSPYFSRPAPPPGPAAGDQALQVSAPDPSPLQPGAGIPPTAPVGATPGPNESAAAPSEPPKPLRLQFEVLEKCWVSVNSDGNRVLVKLLEPGDTQSFDATDRFYIVLGNAGGVRLRLNEKAAKPLGKPGEVVKVLITLQNVEEFLEPPGS